MANLIVCCDGTWNDSNNKDEGVLALTNVRKLFNALEDHNEKEQQTRYQAGVGTAGTVDKALGGIFGIGISTDIMDCYYWLCDKYKPEDRIYLFGFSRGAFCARSLAGMICKYGFAHFPEDADAIARAEIIHDIYEEGYRRNLTRKELEDVHQITFHEKSDSSIHFIGVWDTVGALGVPDDKVIANIFDNPKDYQFHDVSLLPKVSHARQALAIDEMRSSFTPTLWKKGDGESQKSFDKRVKQVWFPGAHADIGGGYRDSRLADFTLKWMVEQISALPDEGVATQLRYRKGFQEMLTQDVKVPGEIHDSHTGFMKVLLSRPRAIPRLDDASQVYTDLVKAIAEDPRHPQFPYRTQVAFSGGKAVKDIYAKHPWNWTGIYLEKDKEYHFSATGMWNSGNVVCGPGGSRDGKFQRAEAELILRSAMDVAEKVWKFFSKKEKSDFWLSRRHGNAHWLSLMGCIANEAETGRDGTPPSHQFFRIGEKTTITPTRSGYFYCYANDAWGCYEENRNYVTLTVEVVTKQTVGEGVEAEAQLTEEAELPVG
ncbi:DUF2235 domain-containing protein [Microbulbifer bruguierae]|uniref:DUF2235 domain-containing protein n=1 Tax=Microbulbifer bruguierae TaxID=3029061 RepID=A0ABY8NBQ6_9GAMM|nr:DUF2235 domain-containing protein [Microbulbifer bruguierae]WGL15875.1 DUF2235 domain-containing protein [Microbulbifer bruguierae]